MYIGLYVYTCINACMCVSACMDCMYICIYVWLNGNIKAILKNRVFFAFYIPSHSNMPQDRSLALILGQWNGHLNQVLLSQKIPLPQPIGPI